MALQPSLFPAWCYRLLIGVMEGSPAVLSLLHPTLNAHCTVQGKRVLNLGRHLTAPRETGPHEAVADDDEADEDEEGRSSSSVWRYCRVLVYDFEFNGPAPAATPRAASAPEATPEPAASPAASPAGVAGEHAAPPPSPASPAPVAASPDDLSPSPAADTSPTTPATTVTAEAAAGVAEADAIPAGMVKRYDSKGNVRYVPAAEAEAEEEAAKQGQPRAARPFWRARFVAQVTPSTNPCCTSYLTPSQGLHQPLFEPVSSPYHAPI